MVELGDTELMSLITSNQMFFFKLTIGPLVRLG